MMIRILNLTTFFTAFFTFVASYAFLVTSHAVAQDWQLVNRQAAFASPRALGSQGQFLVWAGEYGSIGVSTNGGEDWKVTSEDASTLNAVYVLSAQQALVGGNDGTLLLTSNGGGSWISIATNRQDDILSISGNAGSALLTTSTGAVAHVDGMSISFIQVADEAIYVSAMHGDSSIAITTTGKVYRKSAGSGWEQISTIAGATPRQIVFHNGLWWVAGESWTMFSSPNLRDWTKHDIEPSASQVPFTTLRVGVLDDDRVVALASEESQLIYEAYVFNGQTWQHDAGFEPSLFLRAALVSGSDFFSVTSRRIYRIGSLNLYEKLYESMGRSYADVDVSGVTGYAAGTHVDPDRGPSTVIERSTDGGINWSIAFDAERDLAARSVAALPSGWAIVGADSGNYLITLDGQNWQLKHLPTTNLLKFVAASEAGDVYALVHPNVLFHSADMGQTFTPLASQPSTVGVLDLEVLKSGEIRILETKAVKISINKGESWTSRQLDVPMSAFASRGDTVLFASTASGTTTLYRSVDGAQTVTPVHVMSVPMQIFDIVFQESGNVVASANGSWTLRSSDRGQSWIEERLAATPEALLGASVTPNGFVTVGNSGSVWQLTLPQSHVRTESENDEVPKSSYIYPNPTTGIVNIVEPAQWQSVKILDMLGRTMTQMNFNLSGTLDLSSLPNGSYLLVLEGPDTVQQVPLIKL